MRNAAAQNCMGEARKRAVRSALRRARDFRNKFTEDDDKKTEPSHHDNEGYPTTPFHDPRHAARHQCRSQVLQFEDGAQSGGKDEGKHDADMDGCEELFRIILESENLRGLLVPGFRELPHFTLAAGENGNLDGGKEPHKRDQAQDTQNLDPKCIHRAGDVSKLKNGKGFWSN